MNRTISTAVLALPLAVALTLGATAAHAAEGHSQFPTASGFGGAVQPGPPGPGDIAQPENDPQPPVPGPDEFVNPEPQPQPPAPQPAPQPQPPAPQPQPEPQAEEPVEDEVEEFEADELAETDADDEDAEKKPAQSAPEEARLAGLPLIAAIGGAIALLAAFVAVLLARRARRRTA